MVVLEKLMKSSGIAALAAGIAFVALPSAAMADPGDGHRGGEGRGGEQRGGGNWGGGGGGNWSQRPQPASQAQMPAPAPRPQVQAAPQSAPQARGWNGGGRGNWGGQGQGQRDWNNGGASTRPVPTWQNRGGEAVIQSQRNPAYADPNRNRDYGANRGQDNRGGPDRWQRDGNGWRNSGQGRPQQGWDGNRWNGQNNGNRGGDHDRGGWDRNNGHNQWNRDWRRDNRYNWSGWRQEHRDIFRMGRYNPPYRDWSYRRLSIGFYLESGFFGSNYLIDDPWEYRLPPAYGPYRWVRYYDDALLVNIYDGEVVDVLYDFFW